MKKFDLSPHSANFITGLIYLISAFASPVFGILGRNSIELLKNYLKIVLRF